MTARMDYDTEKAKEEGFDGFLQKPFNLKTLEGLFGRHIPEDNKTQACEFTDFPELCEMMDDDAEAIRGILTVFAHSTADNLVAMNQHIENNDFVSAQALCHKMLPMFVQLQQDATIPFLYWRCFLKNMR